LTGSPNAYGVRGNFGGPAYAYAAARV